LESLLTYQEARTVFVGNVPITAKEKTIRKLFHEFGTVEAVRFRSAARPDLKTTKKVRFNLFFVCLFVTIYFLVISVADRGCLSRILIFVHPGSRIPDPKTGTKEKGEKINLLSFFFVATNITKLKNYFI
jgi:hypothetical protein